MIRHCLIAALRNMAASRLLSAISILGLAIGFAGAFLMAVVIRNELTYENFLPGYERTYIFLSHDLFQVDKHTSNSDHRMAELLRLNMPGIEAAGSITGGRYTLKRGMVAEVERINWADPDIFSVLPFPALHGDLANALRRPDGIVLTRAMAQKYFGRDDVVGQGIDLDGHPMFVRAVIQDPPLHATRFTDMVYASDRAPFFARDPLVKGQYHLDSTVYVRLKPGAAVADINKNIPALYNTLAPHTLFAPPGQNALLLRIDRAHLDDDLNPGITARNSGITAKLAAGGAIAFLILFIAVANFVNLAVGQATRRQREIGVRKACGASRRDLIRQFLGEALVPVALAGLIALALVEAVLPVANAFLQTAALFAYWRDPLLALGLVLAVAIVGLTAGAYPAFILSGFKPATVLKGWIHAIGHGGTIRDVLVATQFAILVVLVIASTVVYQQRNFAARDAIRADIDQILIVKKNACKPVFVDGVRSLPGVKDAACSNDMILDSLVIEARPYKGKTLYLYRASADARVFPLYGIKPIAGSFPTSAGQVPGVVINRGVLAQLGFASPDAALGQAVWQQGPFKNLRVAAVVPDFSFHSVEWPQTPTVFTPCDAQKPDAQCSALLHIRLSGQQIPETLDAIDRLWKATGGQGPINRFFLDEHLQTRYIDLLHQAELFTLFAGIAVFLACLGLVGIAISTAERRTKEIGVRKAAGATSLDIVMMLLWQFSQPVLWANVAAWPLAWWLMNRWLAGFSAHVELHAWLFVTASAATLAIALLTVAGQAFLVARRKPVLALRYE